MFEGLLTKYGYIAILLGTVFEGETIMIMGGFSAHRGYLKLLTWVILAGFVGNFIQNQGYFILGRRYGTRTVEKHPEWKPRLQQVHRCLERYQSALITGRLDNENTGLIILLLLALTTFFAGIHLGWRLFIVGIFLGLALIGATYLEEFVWMFLIIALVVVAIFLLLKHYAGTKIGEKVG